MSPQLADFDGDGIQDLYTGCFEGGLYLLFGMGSGKFAPPTALLDKSGGVLRLGQYWDDDKNQWAGSKSSKYPEELGIAAAAIDWDNDGDLDLILGSYKGGMFLRRNLGSAKAYSYPTDDESLEAGGEPLIVESGHAMPTIADWDGDGNWDLLSGSENGAVRWWRNVGEKGSPKFAAPLALVEKSNKAADAPGTRTQVSVCDFDADGRLDLLLGDYRSEARGDERPTFHGYVWWFRRIAAP